MKARRASKRIVGAALVALAVACGRIGYDVDDRASAIVTSSGGGPTAGTLTGSSDAAGIGGAFGAAGASADVGAGGFASAGAAGGILGPTTSVAAGTSTSGAGGTTVATGGASASGSGAGGAADGGLDSAGAGGASGSGGIESGGTDAGMDASKEATPVGRCDDNADVRLYYRRVDRGGPLDFDIKIENKLGRSLSLSTIKLRYFITNEIMSTAAAVLYGDICCPDVNIFSRVNATIVPMNSPASTADAYVEVTFDSRAGNVDPGHTVEVEVQLAGTRGTPNQNNDYSYIASASGSQQRWDACPGPVGCDVFRSCVSTVLVDDVLVWGTPP
jgi:hypothetical protein